MVQAARQRVVSLHWGYEVTRNHLCPCTLEGKCRQSKCRQDLVYIYSRHKYIVHVATVYMSMAGNIKTMAINNVTFCLHGELTLVDELVEGVLAIGARLPPHDGACGVFNTGTLSRHRLPIGLHVSLSRQVYVQW